MSVVDDIKSRLDIVDIVSGYVNLQKAGRNYKALCPFHQEKTPSFVVFPETQTWRCFGACNEGGDVFSFVMKSEGWDFPEALRELAHRAGVELRPQSPQQSEQQAKRERLRGLLEEAARFFHRQLLEAPAAEIARAYVLKRGLTEETVRAFVLGYAPNDWRQALHHLQELGYSEDEIVEAGVATRKEEGKRPYDRFRHRLMIPIRDRRGRTVGFGARALAKDAVPKYLNSPQGLLFDKSHLLFGLDMARRAIRESEVAVIVEGYMDVMQAHQAGYANVVAQMGTALTEEQLRRLSRYADTLILALDPDAAGINATMRGLNVASQTLDGAQQVSFDPRGIVRYTGKLSVDLRVVSLPEGQDPDDLIRDDPAAWEALLERAVPVAEYVIRQATAHLGPEASLAERERVARALLPILTATENDLQRHANVQALARRVRIDERWLLEWAQRVSATPQRRRRSAPVRPQPSARPTVPQPARPSGFVMSREQFCLRLLIEEPEWLFSANRKLRELQNGEPHMAQTLAPLQADDFTRSDYQAIFRALQEALRAGEADPLDYLLEHLPPPLADEVAELSMSPLESFQRKLPPMLESELASVVREQARIHTLPKPDEHLFTQEALALRHATLERRLQELYFLQQEAQQHPNGHDVEHYDTQINATILARQRIARALQAMRKPEQARD